MAKGEPVETQLSANATRLRETIALLPQTLSKFHACSSAIPSHEDFHFYSNFPEFRDPVLGIQSRVETLLSRISSLNVIPRAPSWSSDPDESRDWLVAVQDEILERVDSAVDLFKKERAKQGLAIEDDGFMPQKVRKKRRKDATETQLSNDSKGNSGVTVTGSTKTERCPVPFHVRSIPRPQDKFDISVDNSNTPFKHPKRLLKHTLAETSTTRKSLDAVAETLVDPTKLIHPLEEELRGMEFESCRVVGARNPKQPESLSKTPFTFIDSPAALQDLSAKLVLEREIAVDLEHHHFRSFQGLTCLMQISTQLEDFIIDTLELRSFIGPQLQDVFANPTIEKVMHGADWDILWLQRDFGIYVCNLFDTGQASRVLGMKSYGLSYLLERFCGVITDKRYQLADWRLRPLPTEMLKYAREDTHYLLYVKDVMKQMLVSTQCGDLTGQEPLLEVYKRSRDICLKLYEKEITTERSYLQVYGLHEKQFGAEQLAVLAGLYSWRDQVARSEDESTGYVLPNHLLLKLAEGMPDTVKKLRSMLSGRHHLLARNLVTIVDIICKSRLKASMFLHEARNLRLEAEKSKNVLGQPSCLERSAFDQMNLKAGKGEVSGDLVSKMLERVEVESTTSDIKQTLPIFLEGHSVADSTNLVKDDPQMKISEKECIQVGQQIKDKVNFDHNVGGGLSCFPAESPSKHRESMDGAIASRVVVNRAKTSSLFGSTKERDSSNVKPESSVTHQHLFASSPQPVKSDEAVMVALDCAKEKKSSEGSMEFQRDRDNALTEDEFARTHSVSTMVTENMASSKSKDHSTSIVRVVKKPVAGLACLLGRRSVMQVEGKSQRGGNEDPEQMEARLKARIKTEEIKASLTLPFHTFDGTHQSHHAASEHEETPRKPMVLKETNELGQLSKDCEEDLQPEDVLFFEPDFSSINEEHGEQEVSESLHLLKPKGSGTDDECEPEKSTNALDASRKGIGITQDGSMHRLWWPVVLSPSQQLSSDRVEEIKESQDIGYLDAELPLSISEKYYHYQQIKAHDSRDGPPSWSLRNSVSAELSDFHKQDKSFDVLQQCEGIQQRHLISRSGRELIEENCGEKSVPLVPFDYAAAKKTMNYFRGFTELNDDIRRPDKNGSKLFRQFNNDNHFRSNDSFFDPLRMKEFRPEGITPGKRRQVFPQTGNRTGFFK